MNRGSFQDLIFLVGFAFVMVIGGLVIYYVFHQAGTNTGTALINAGANVTTTNAMTTGIDSMTSSFVNGLPIGLFLAGLGVIALASFIPVSPVFLPIGLIMIVASVVFAVFVSNAAAGVFGTDFFVPLVAQFPLAAAFIQQLPLFAAVVGVILMIVIYGRIRVQGGGAPEG